MKDHIVRWYSREKIRISSQWLTKAEAEKLASELLDNDMAKIVIERAHPAGGYQPVAMYRC